VYRVITIQQPWAWGIVNGWKDCENRSWYHAYRGPIWIHAGKSREGLEYTTPEDWESEGSKYLFPGLPPYTELTFGAIVGEAEILDCVPPEQARAKKKSIHYHGPWCFTLGAFRRLKTPIPWVGQLGICRCDLEPSDDLFHPYEPERIQSKPRKKRGKPT